MSTEPKTARAANAPRPALAGDDCLSKQDMLGLRALIPNKLLADAAKVDAFLLDCDFFAWVSVNDGPPPDAGAVASLQRISNLAQRLRGALDQFAHDYPAAELVGYGDLLDRLVREATDDAGVPLSRQNKRTKTQGAQLAEAIARAFQDHFNRPPPKHKSAWFVDFMKALGESPRVGLKIGADMTAQGIATAKEALPKCTLVSRRRTPPI